MGGIAHTHGGTVHGGTAFGRAGGGTARTAYTHTGRHRIERDIRRAAPHREGRCQGC
jgi:hypothetical protein